MQRQNAPCPTRCPTRRPTGRLSAERPAAAVASHARRDLGRDFGRGFAIGVIMMSMLTVLVVGSYLAKSAAGINLIDGPSILHAPLYHLIR